ncbi:MAG TPA: AAA family ATPase [Firmicutes bacterium]|jgi:lon-related putative ATP-dependent protease|nr:AAA family ATPase [Bacillota bacterium]
MLTKKRLPAEKVFKKCNIDLFGFETTDNFFIQENIIGQERAVQAMEFGLKIKRHGYNIFITGPTGTGRSSYAKSSTSEVAEKQPVPDDWCYLNNFRNPDSPIVVNLQAGLGSIFARDIANLLEEFNESIPKAFNTDDYERQKGAILKEFQETRSTLMEELNNTAMEKGFIIKRSGGGFLSVPAREGKELSEEVFNQLNKEEKETLEKQSTEVQLKAMEIIRRIQNEEKKLKNKFKELEYRTGHFAVDYLVDDLKEKYKGYPMVVRYLEELQEDVLGNLGDFKDDDDEKQLSLPWLRRSGQEAAAKKYFVNLIVDNKETKGAPVVVESNPTYYNLIGRIEYENHMGTVTTDFTMIKGGALHRANGGYLILQAKDVLLNLQSWEVLKRVLTNREIRIESIGEQYAILPMASLKPKPIPLDVKVILIGNPFLYHLLYRNDEDFRKLFKLKVDFETEMDRSLDNIHHMAGFISAHCQRENLKHFDRSGVARVVEYSSRLAEHQEKLTTCFNDIVEILYEADTWATIAGSDIVTGQQVEKAIREKVYRSDKYEQKLQEMIAEGKILLDLEGEKEGQVNGLAILDMGDYYFGKPSRITVTTFLGRRGIVNIERESKMSGRIHDKGVLILSGYMGQKYARETPLSLTANICFEQSYDGVDGDSASSTELYALLSSLSGVPLKQNIAVTGSVNQKGEIQPVGGITGKVEGFFAVCKQRGLTGDQGVMIPRQNIVNLMLDEEVVAAIEKGKFHIYAVDTIDEGLEVLTGIPAGERDGDGRYPKGTINYLVQRNLETYNELITRKSKEQDRAEHMSNENVSPEESARDKE